MSKKMLPPLHLASGDDELRPALGFIEIKKGIATATNAMLISQLNLSVYSLLDDETIKKLNGKLIHRDIWESVMDAEEITVDENILHYKKGSVKADYDISCDYKFPNHKVIIDAVANSIFAKHSFICFNPKWVEVARKIFPSENLIMRFYENNEMMVLFPSGDAKGFIGIMPMKITEEEAVVDFTLS